MIYCKNTPWEANLLAYSGHLGISILDKNGNCVANVYLDEVNTKWGRSETIEQPENAQALSHAHVIRAAPDLFRDLEYLVHMLKHLIDFPEDKAVLTKLIVSAELSLNKAKGL